MSLTLLLEAHGIGPLAHTALRRRTLARAQDRYLDSIAPWRDGRGYRVPAEYLIVAAQRPEA